MRAKPRYISLQQRCVELTGGKFIVQTHRGPKRILVDGVYLALEMKGVGRYTANVLRELETLDTRNEFLILVRAGQALPVLPQGERFRYIPFRLADHYRHGILTLPRLARELAADTVWIPYESTFGNFPCPYWVVCHDVPQLILDSQRRGGASPSLGREIVQRVDRTLMERSLRGAATVFANSHFVGAWLHEGCKIPRERICYAPCAPGADFATLSANVNPDAVRADLDCLNGYVLVFATGDRRENLVTVLDVFDVLARETNLNLVLAGIRGNEADDLRAHLQKFGWQARVRLLPFLGENEMQRLAGVYASATVYLDLSLHEGFGMQVIETMTCGTPVVCSDRGALPEVGGSAALFCDPFDVAGICNAIFRVLNDETLRTKLVALGAQQAKQFSWQATSRVIARAMLNPAGEQT